MVGAGTAGINSPQVKGSCYFGMTGREIEYVYCSCLAVLTSCYKSWSGPSDAKVSPS